MKHPTPESLQPLLNAIDTACWCLAVKRKTRKGVRCKVDWQQAIVELEEAWSLYQITHDDRELAKVGVE